MRVKAANEVKVGDTIMGPDGKSIVREISEFQGKFRKTLNFNFDGNRCWSGLTLNEPITVLSEESNQNPTA